MSNVVLWKLVALTALVGSQGALAQTPIPQAPRDFVMAVSESDQYEILAARVASVQGEDSRVRTFAQQMIQDHTRLTEDFRKAILASGLSLPPAGLSSDQAALLSSLQSVRGQVFDKTYARQQELAHAQAVAVQDSFASAGADANLRAAVQSALPSIRDHPEKARQLFSALTEH